MSSASGDYQYPYCDYFVNIDSCPYADAHWKVIVSALAFSVFTLLNAASYLALSWSTNGVPYVTPGVRMKSVDGTMALLALSVILRALDEALLINNAFVSYTARYVLMNIGQVVQFQAAVYFLYAIVHSIPNVYLDSKGRMRDTLMPPRWVFLAFCAILLVFQFGSVIGTSIYLGVSFDEGGLTATSNGYTILFAFWAFNMFAIAFAFVYFGDRLLKVIENNDVGKANRNHTMKQAIRRIKVMIYALAPTLFFCSVSMVLMSILHQPIFWTHQAALFIAAVFHFSITSLICTIAGILIMMELSSEHSDHSSGSGSSSGTPQSARRSLFSRGKTGDNSNTKAGKTSSALKSDSASHLGASPLESNTSTSLVLNTPSVILQEAVNSIELKEHTQPLSIELLAL